MNARRPGDDPPGSRSIAAELRRRINSGDIEDGAIVPGEAALMKEHGISRDTARRALDELKNEGLIVTRQGSRTRVRKFAPLHRKGTERLARTHWGSGRAIWEADAGGRDWVADTEVTQEPADEEVAAALGIAAGEPVIVRSRTHSIGDRPVQLSTSWLPASIAAGTPIAEVDTGPGGTYARLLDLGHPPARFTEVVSARMPSPDEAEELDLPQGTPVILITRTAMTESGVMVEVNKMVLDAYAYRLEYGIEA